MQKLCSLVVISTLVHGSVALATSYQKTDGTVIDPILDTASFTHPYNGPDLEPDAWLDWGEDLSNVWMEGADLSSADLSSADLSSVDLSSVDLSSVDLSSVDLSSVDLSSVDLTDSFLWNTNMESADLTGANLSSAFLGYANLTSASLRYTNLTGANLGKGEDLSCETCPSANLNGADLTGANLTGENLTDSLLDNAIFSHDSVLHDGQTVSQWGCDESGLQAYLEGTRSAFGANNLTIVPAPSTLSLLAIGGLTVFRRRRASFPRHP
jgi:uncharacterized protein YjbI with pentapeptide repeats